MIETIFTLEDEPMTPETPSTDAPEEGGVEEGAESMPAALLEDEGEEGETTPEAILEDEEGEKSEDAE
jgi:hypothetical protein